MVSYVRGEPPAQAGERGGRMQRFEFEVTVLGATGEVDAEAALVARDAWIDAEWTTDGRRMDEAGGSFIVYMVHADLYAALLAMFKVRESLYPRLPDCEVRFRRIKEAAVA